MNTLSCTDLTYSGSARLIMLYSLTFLVNHSFTVDDFCFSFSNNLFRPMIFIFVDDVALMAFFTKLYFSGVGNYANP